MVYSPLAATSAAVFPINGAFRVEKAGLSSKNAALYWNRREYAASLTGYKRTTRLLHRVSMTTESQT